MSLRRFFYSSALAAILSFILVDYTTSNYHVRSIFFTKFIAPAVATFCFPRRQRRLHNTTLARRSRLQGMKEGGPCVEVSPPLPRRRVPSWRTESLSWKTWGSTFWRFPTWQASFVGGTGSFFVFSMLPVRVHHPTGHRLPCTPHFLLHFFFFVLDVD